jgi:hypothetical protein
MTPRRIMTILLAAGLLASACGSGSKKVDPAADLALVKGAVLTGADLPGYSGTAHTSADDVPAAIKKSFATCMKVPATIFDDSPGSQKADSQDFSKGEAGVSSEIKIYPTKSDVDDRWRQASNSITGPCLARLFENGAKLGTTAGNAVKFVSSSGTQFKVGVGARSVGYSLKLTLTSGTQTTVLYADILFVQRDRAALALEAVDVGATPNRAFEIALGQTVYDRLGTKTA